MVTKVLSHAHYLPWVVNLVVIMVVLMGLEIVRGVPAPGLPTRLMPSRRSSLHLILGWVLWSLELLPLHHVRRWIVYKVLLGRHHSLGIRKPLKVSRSIVSHVL